MLLPIKNRKCGCALCYMSAHVQGSIFPPNQFTNASIICFAPFLIVLWLVYISSLMFLYLPNNVIFHFDWCSISKCDRPPQTSRKVGIFYSEIQGKIHGKVVFWWNWDFNGIEMFISSLKLLAKYQLSFLLQNISKLTFSRCSCTGNVYKMKTLRHVFSVLRIMTCHASKNRNSTSGRRMNLKQLSI